MKTTKYLYGVSPMEFVNFSYVDALRCRIKSAKHLVTELLTPHYTERDQVRLTEVLKAIKFNIRLLKEMNEWH